MLDVVVGFLLVDRQLLSSILQTEHAKTVVKALLVDAVLAFNFSVVSGCSDADTVVADVVLLQLYLKQTFVVPVV